MVTKGDKIAFSLIAVLFILAIVFRKDIASVFDGGNKGEERKEKKDKKDKKEKNDNKKEGQWAPVLPPGGEGRTVLYPVRA